MPARQGRAALPVLERLRRLAHGRAWVKGAVNYDEDLHFSTYYLRASCPAVTVPLYPGYSCVVASYEHFNEAYYLLEDECRESATAILRRALRQRQWLPRILCEIKRRSEALADIFPPDTSAATLARLSDARLLSLYRRHDACNRILYRYARLPEALDRGVSCFTNYLMERLRNRGLGADECAEAFAVLSQPVVPSVLAQEILDFGEIVRYARSEPAAVPNVADGPGRARMLLDRALFERLEAHLAKWKFLPYHGYGRRQLATLDDYVGRLLAQVLNSGPAAEGAGLMSRCAQAQRERQELLGRLKLDPAHAALFELYPEIGAVKLYRRYAQLRNFYFLDLLLAEIGRRLGVSEWTVRSMLPEEVMTSLRRGKLADPAVGERLGGCVFAVLDEEEFVLTGREAESARQLFRSEPAGNGKEKVLQGVVACRGKAAGPCRVVIRADDCRGGFAKGSILVSESTDPDLLPLMRVAGGVLTEQGGVTSHAAIICRELGVPTIIGVPRLLESVRDGDWVDLDAERGVITISRPPEQAGRAVPSLPPSPGAIGAKAANLEVVRSMGFAVPEYVVLPCEEVQRVAGQPEASASCELVQRVLAELRLSPKDTLAVRSSAVAEDCEEGSCAGQYRSLLRVGQDRLAAALREFLQSNEGSRNGRPAYRGSVIVQRMVRADCAGVCLTRDERTGKRDAVIIEMAAGHNTGVTGGTVRPDRLVVDRLTGDILEDHRHCTALRPRALDISGMVQQFLALELLFGKPLDIEWALAGQQLYILQARPIVSVRRGKAAALKPETAV
jgi:phosphohistidine swiveling domain-containing protein